MQGVAHVAQHDIQPVVHELQVYQMDLERQNEAVRHTQMAFDRSVIVM